MKATTSDTTPIRSHHRKSALHMFEGFAPSVPPADRVAAGRALRAKVARSDHAEWRSHHGRPDPTRILHESDEGRLRDLIPIRYGRMLQSPFTFFRGAASVMAADLATTLTTGFRVQACGDCHLLNFGGFATPERNVLFDINDFDETQPAPWEWDLKRLAVSFVLLARANGLRASDGLDAVVTCVRAYRKHLREYAEMHPLDVWYSRITGDDFVQSLPSDKRDIVRDRIDAVTKRRGSDLDFPKLTGSVAGQVVIRDRPPLIFHPTEARDAEFHATLMQVFHDYRETLDDDRKVLLDRYRIVDAAINVVGIGSVGRRCWIALLMSASNDPLFLQFKEAVASVLEPYVGRGAYPHHGQRVVMGQRLMQPASDLFLGWVTAPSGAHFYVRQLRDAKIKPLVEAFDAEFLTIYARICGWSLARAHAKASDVCAIAGYLGSSDSFDVAIGKFATHYADQVERDHARLAAAVRKGTIAVINEV